ncbi:MAG TPA: hypothetical protein V6C95_08395, partial [Coleofasciculaceae cyanobacterium]
MLTTDLNLSDRHQQKASPKNPGRARVVATTDRTPFDIRSHLDKLTPAKGKNRYICPVCEDDNMTIDPNTAEYQCWSGCECKD